MYNKCFWPSECVNLGATHCLFSVIRVLRYISIIFSHLSASIKSRVIYFTSIKIKNKCLNTNKLTNTSKTLMFYSILSASNVTKYKYSKVYIM